MRNKTDVAEYTSVQYSDGQKQHLNINSANSQNIMEYIIIGEGNESESIENFLNQQHDLLEQIMDGDCIINDYTEKEVLVDNKYKYKFTRDYKIYTLQHKTWGWIWNLPRQLYESVQSQQPLDLAPGSGRAQWIISPLHFREYPTFWKQVHQFTIENVMRPIRTDD